MKVLKAVTVLLLALLSLTACSTAQAPVDTPAAKQEASQVEDLLGTASVVVLEKAPLSVGDVWTVKVDSREVAKVQGLAFPVMGDVYSLTGLQGGFIAGEEEKIFTWAKTANFYNREKQVEAVLTKELLSWTAQYNLRNASGLTLASLKQDFALGLKGTIKTADGQDAWMLQRDLVSLGARITLTRVKGGVSAQHAILMVTVANEIYESNSNK